MNISSTKLPKLPQPPNNGRGRLEVDINYDKADMVETRLGSIPADYDSWSGWEGRERIYFRGQEKEASNPYGYSVNIWREQPLYNSDGTPRLKNVTETIVAEPKGELGTAAKWGAIGAGIGAAAGGGRGSRHGARSRTRSRWRSHSRTHWWWSLRSE